MEIIKRGRLHFLLEAEMNTEDFDGEYDANDVYSESNKERDICPACNGSGEGMYDGGSCSNCKGSGETKS